MARKQKQVLAKDYDALIKESKEKIDKLTIDLKLEKKNLKQLEKDKVRFEEQKIAAEQEKEKEQLVELISNSGKTLEEIKEFLSK